MYCFVVDTVKDPEIGKRRHKWYSVGPARKQAECRAVRDEALF